MAPGIAIDSTPLSLNVGGNAVNVTLSSLTGDPLPTVTWSLIIDGAPEVATTAMGSGTTRTVMVPENDGSYTSLEIVATATNSEGTDDDSVIVTVEL